MGLFEHLKFVAGMKAETSLQKMEDPSQVFDYNYTKQLEHLQQLRQGLVSIVQNEKHVETNPWRSCWRCSSCLV